jgi:hypothetical protein
MPGIDSLAAGHSKSFSKAVVKTPFRKDMQTRFNTEAKTRYHEAVGGHSRKARRVEGHTYPAENDYRTELAYIGLKTRSSQSGERSELSQPIDTNPGKAPIAVARGRPCRGTECLASLNSGTRRIRHDA